MMPFVMMLKKRDSFGVDKKKFKKENHVKVDV